MILSHCEQKTNCQYTAINQNASNYTFFCYFQLELWNVYHEISGKAVPVAVSLFSGSDSGAECTSLSAFLTIFSELASCSP